MPRAYVCKTVLRPAQSQGSRLDFLLVATNPDAAAVAAAPRGSTTHHGSKEDSGCSVADTSSLCHYGAQFEDQVMRLLQCMASHLASPQRERKLILYTISIL